MKSKIQISQSGSFPPYILLTKADLPQKVPNQLKRKEKLPNSSRNFLHSRVNS